MCAFKKVQIEKSELKQMYLTLFRCSIQLWQPHMSVLEKLAEELASHSKVSVYRKRTVFPSDKNDDVHFLYHGVIREFWKTDDGGDKTENIQYIIRNHKKSGVALDWSNRKAKVPMLLVVRSLTGTGRQFQTLMDSIVIRISREKWNEIQETNGEWRQTLLDMKIFFEGHIMDLELAMQQLRTESLEKKVQWFWGEYLEQIEKEKISIQNQYIASFLDMTQQSYSRIIKSL